MRRFLWCAISLAALVGCGSPPNTGPKLPGERGGSLSVAPVADDRFAETVKDLLASEPRSEARRVLLAQTMSRQLVRAAAHFTGNAPDRGLASVTGAFALASVSEIDAASLGPAAKGALAGAAKELSNRGDEGAAFAAYAMLARLSTEGDRKEIEAHLEAIGRWIKDLRAGSAPMAGVQLAKSAAVARAVLEPSDVALAEAAARTTEWFERALELRSKYRSAQVLRSLNRRDQEEAILAHAALRSAPIVLAALYLRHGDAKGASQALEKVRARELVPQLAAAVDGAKTASAERWLELLRALQPEEREEVDASLQTLLRVAQFRVAAEAYRLDPTSVDAAGDLALALVDFDMLEAAPAVVVEAVRVHPEPRTIAAALALSMQAMMKASDGDGARRVFRAAGGLLAIADGAKAKIQPSPASVRALMGEIELRDGHVAEARELLHRAASVEPTGPVSATLARIARSEGKTDDALRHIDDATRSPEGQRSPALRGEILLMKSDIQRERGQDAAARATLGDALRGLAEARKATTDDARARVERTLAKVLDRFGAGQKARQALERAFDAAPRDKQEASATLLTMASRALRELDLAAARDDLRRGVAADLPAEDIVYLALWVRIVERHRKVSADPVAERAMTGIKDDGRWTSRLAAFGTGKIGVSELTQSARTPAQRTEALFYGAMEQRILGDQKGAEATLQRVVQSSGGIELMEVTIARELLAGARAALGGPVPDVGLP